VPLGYELLCLWRTDIEALREGWEQREAMIDVGFPATKYVFHEILI
jgi:hypothetical protein